MQVSISVPRSLKLNKAVLMQNLIAFTIAYMVSMQAILNGINAFTNYIGLSTTLDTAVCYAVLVIAVLGCQLAIIGCYGIKPDTVLVTLSCLAVYVGCYIFFPQNRSFMFTSVADYAANPLYLIFLYSLPGYFLIRCLRSPHTLHRYFKPFSYGVVLLSAFVYFYASDSSAAQYMTLSYNMLLQTVYLMSFPPKKRKALHYTVIGIGVFIIAVGGARGALLGLLVYVALRILYQKTISAKTLWLFGGIILGAAILTMFYQPLLLGLSSLLEGWGVESRTLQMMLTSGEDFSTGRIEIYNTVLENIRVFGYGLFGDQVLMGRYPHNFILEWLLNYGALFGTILTAAYFVIFIKGLLKRKGPFWDIITIFVPNGFIALLFSGSYLGQVPAFYILIGLCVNAITARNTVIEDDMLCPNEL